MGDFDDWFADSAGPRAGSMDESANVFDGWFIRRSGAATNLWEVVMVEGDGTE